MEVTTMKMNETSLFDWQKHFATEESCIETLIKIRWANGFVCPKCAHKKACYIVTRALYQCSKCQYQSSITAGTIFHSTKLPLVMWFWAIYLTATDKGGISALRLAKQIGVSWPTAWRMLHKIRAAMKDRDSIYRLQDIIELDDTLVGGKCPGKRGRGAGGKAPVVVAVEKRDRKAGFMAATVVPTISKATIKDFLNHKVLSGQIVHTDALSALNIIGEDHKHEAKITPPSKASEWLPLVHIVIGNLKTFLNGTFHGVSQEYLQEYIDEFCYRFNRRSWEDELPFRLLNACLSHIPVHLY
jgi:transposase-like protein